MICGIYKILNRINGKYYIGGSVNIILRWSRHKNDLNKNKHPNTKLQNAWNKYGEENFKFEVLELIDDKQKLKDIEQNWLNVSNCCKDEIGYNLSNNSTGYSLNNNYRIGKLHTEETKIKMSQARKGKAIKYTPRIYTETHKKNISEGQKGKIVTQETKDKISKGNKGKIRNDEYRAKMSKIKKGIKFTEEHKRKLSEAHKARHLIADTGRNRV